MHRHAHPGSYTMDIMHTQKGATCGTGGALVLRIMQPRPLELPLSFQFMPRRWYHLVLTHSPGGALSASLVHLFVDGTLEGSGKFRFPKVWP